VTKKVFHRLTAILLSSAQISWAADPGPISSLIPRLERLRPQISRLGSEALGLQEVSAHPLLNDATKFPFLSRIASRDPVHIGPVDASPSADLDNSLHTFRLAEPQWRQLKVLITEIEQNFGLAHNWLLNLVRQHSLATTDKARNSYSIDMQLYPSAFNRGVLAALWSAVAEVLDLKDGMEARGYVMTHENYHQLFRSDEGADLLSDFRRPWASDLDGEEAFLSAVAAAWGNRIAGKPNDVVEFADWYTEEFLVQALEARENGQGMSEIFHTLLENGLPVDVLMRHHVDINQRVEVLKSCQLDRKALLVSRGSLTIVRMSWMWRMPLHAVGLLLVFAGIGSSHALNIARGLGPILQTAAQTQVSPGLSRLLIGGIVFALFNILLLKWLPKELTRMISWNFERPIHFPLSSGRAMIRLFNEFLASDESRHPTSFAFEEKFLIHISRLEDIQNLCLQLISRRRANRDIQILRGRIPVNLIDTKRINEIFKANPALAAKASSRIEALIGPMLWLYRGLPYMPRGKQSLAGGSA